MAYLIYNHRVGVGGGKKHKPQKSKFLHMSTAILLVLENTENVTRNMVSCGGWIP